MVKFEVNGNFWPFADSEFSILAMAIRHFQQSLNYEWLNKVGCELWLGSIQNWS